jgi:hypothetical protein
MHTHDLCDTHIGVRLHVGNKDYVGMHCGSATTGQMVFRDQVTIQLHVCY